MSLKLAIDNGRKSFDNMSTVELLEFQQLAVGLPPLAISALYDKVMTPTTPALNTSTKNPDWLESGFNENIWKCSFGKINKEIDFNVELEDGSLLTGIRNQKLLYTLKYWICASTHPINTGGQFFKATTIYRIVLRILHIIDVFLLDAEYLQLSKYGLGLIDYEYCMDIMSRSRSVRELYCANQRVTNFLKSNAFDIVPSDIALMSAKYPKILEMPYERQLDLSDIELLKARVWLITHGAIRIPESSNTHGNCRSNFFTEHLLQNTLHGRGSLSTTYSELRARTINRVPCCTSH
jgi:hypothetical protein